MPLRFACALALLLTAAPASGQWTRIDTNYGVADAYATNLVAADADHLYATVLAGQPTPDRFLILRSADDGDTWAEVFSGFNGGARGVFLGDLDGQWTALIRGNGETALLRSDDGAAWAETAARIPVGTVTGVARDGQTYVAVGSNPSYRSTDGGATWTTFGQDQPMGAVLTFEGAFYGVSGIGQVFRLDGDAWTQVNVGSPFASALFVADGQLWAKASVNSLYASADGTTWTARPTDQPTAWSLAIPTPDDNTPWLLYAPVFAQSLFLSDDDGASATDITGDYPSNSNGTLCTSNYAATPTAVIGNAWACASPDDNGVFRYALGSGNTASATDPEADGLALDVWPTPTNGAASVRLRLDAPAHIEVDVYDALGRRVARLGRGRQPAGEATFAVPAGLVPGVYVVRAEAGGRIVSLPITVVR